MLALFSSRKKHYHRRFEGLGTYRTLEAASSTSEESKPVHNGCCCEFYFISIFSFVTLYFESVLDPLTKTTYTTSELNTATVPSEDNTPNTTCPTPVLFFQMQLPLRYNAAAMPTRHHPWLLSLKSRTTAGE